MGQNKDIYITREAMGSHVYPLTLFGMFLNLPSGFHLAPTQLSLCRLCYMDGQTPCSGIMWRNEL
jgi:hypothetical protein